MAPGNALESIALADLDIVATLGAGTFGLVKLVQHKTTKDTYALKILRKVTPEYYYIIL
jgi:protein kinase A